MFKTAKSSLSVFNKKFRLFNHKYVIAKDYSHYPDVVKVYDFLDKYNYVANKGIYWSHHQSPFIIRVSDDYGQCIKGNQSNDDTCWWYFINRMLPIMKRDFNEQEVMDVKEELRNWKVIQSAQEKYKEWSTCLSRVYAAIPGVPIEQKMFAVKQFASTFYTDDTIEHLSSHPDFSIAADEFSKNLRKIWSGFSHETTDMNQFRGKNNIPGFYIDNAIRSLNIQTELEHLSKKLLKPKVYELHNVYCHDYLNACERERNLFQKHFHNKTYISEEEGKETRFYTIGFKWILATNMTDENTAIYLNDMNPLTNLVAWNTLVENDLIGHCKDKNIEFSPMSFHRKLVQTGKSELEAARQIANSSTEAKRAYEVIWATAPTQHYKHYEYLARYSVTLMDYCFVNGLKNVNDRYGWIPILE